MSSCVLHSALCSPYEILVVKNLLLLILLYDILYHFYLKSNHCRWNLMFPAQHCHLMYALHFLIVFQMHAITYSIDHLFNFWQKKVSAVRQFWYELWRLKNYQLTAQVKLSHWMIGIGVFYIHRWTFYTSVDQVDLYVQRLVFFSKFYLGLLYC